ncbi:aldose 1-epimerase family protein [Palleniella muris]|uniref:Aldose 1-epimerase family protein n=1 Tax=Palleniella muris TaxID=3038145 RepID=A0AC61QP25_9BACT|nr:aldose 1-epimerase family protein [Palleniella muris]TGX81539.1 aldose 1-epimerase family protein [Palleniella muris]
MEIVLKNDRLRVVVDTHGAEITKVGLFADGRAVKDCVWDGNPRWWKRHTPVLFPIVGALWHGVMRHKGCEYAMGQHGFARDSEFEVVAATDDFVEMRLASSEETLKVYPFCFELSMKHEIFADGTITTSWRVANTGSEEMHFQIGGHPAYLLPVSESGGYEGTVRLSGGKQPYRLTTIEAEGCVAQGYTAFEGDVITIAPDTFAHDAFIFETPCPDTVTLCDGTGKELLVFRADCPALGIWAPGRDEIAPFVCIEPWWGRTDRVGYEGDIADREYMQHLAPSASATGCWSVTFK